MNELLYAKDLAKEIALGEQTIRRLAKTCDDFPRVKIGGRTFYMKDEVLRWLQKCCRERVDL